MTTELKKIARLAMCGKCGTHGRLLVLEGDMIIHIDPEQIATRRMARERINTLQEIYPDVDISTAKIEINAQPLFTRRFNTSDKLQFHALYNPKVVREKFEDTRRQALHGQQSEQTIDLIKLGLNEVAEKINQMVQVRELIDTLRLMTIDEPLDFFLRRNRGLAMHPKAKQPKPRTKPVTTETPKMDTASPVPPVVAEAPATQPVAQA